MCYHDISAQPVSEVVELLLGDTESLLTHINNNTANITDDSKNLQQQIFSAWCIGVRTLTTGMQNDVQNSMSPPQELSEKQKYIGRTTTTAAAAAVVECVSALSHSALGSLVAHGQGPNGCALMQILQSVLHAYATRDVKHELKIGDVAPGMQLLYNQGPAG